MEFFTAPYIPYGDEVDLLDAGDQLYASFDKQESEYGETEQDCDLDTFDGFTFTWDRWASPETPILDAFPATPYSEDFVQASCDEQKKGRSIFRNPSVYFARDSRNATKTSDFLDLCYSTSQLSLHESTRPRKLRKRSMSRSNLQQSALASRKSILSMLSELSVRKIKEKKSTISAKHKTGTGCETAVSSGVPNLPSGVTQTGRGIGFTPAHHESRSRMSLASVAPSSCIKGLSALLRFKNKPPPPPKSHDEVARQIYGSTWSLHEAQMSTVTFGIPDGLGPRRDSVDEFGRKLP